MTGCPVHHHGMSKARGCKHVAVGKFGSLFLKHNQKGLAVSEDDARILGGPGGVMHDFDGSSGDCAIPAGYIFFAQFIDHDITLDTTSGLREAPKTGSEVKDLPNIRCEVSVLSDPEPMQVTGIDAIRDALVPGRDGLVIHEGKRRAVFLPVVWEQLPNPDTFVDHLCRKAGIDRRRDGPRVTGETFVAQKWSEH